MPPDRPPDPLGRGLVWRPATEDDIPAIVELQDACYEVDQTYREVASEIRDRFSDEMIDAPVDSLLGFDGDLLVASVWSMAATSAGTKWRAFAESHIRPTHRSDQLRQAALEWWEQRCRIRLSTHDDGLPKVLWRGVYEHQEDEIDLLDRNGYSVVRYYDELIRDLDTPIDAHPLSDGLRLVPESVAGEGDDLRVHNEAFKDHWGSQPWTADRWDHFKNEFYLPEASYVVYDGDDPVGHIFSTSYPHDFDDRGFTHAWIESLAVIRSHRKRGVASALVTRALRDFVEMGMEHALLDVDSENPTGAYGLYEQLGFVHDRRTVAMTKPA